MDDSISRLISDTSWGSLSRRDFILRASALGFGLPAALALLEACGSSSTGSSGGSSSGGGGTIKMGALIPQTGIFAVLAPAMTNNAQLAVDEVNGAGGVQGSQIHLFIEDTASDPNTAVQKARKLIQQDGVDLIIGTLSSAERWAVALSATNPAKMIFINPTYYEGGICNRYFFNAAAVPNQQIQPFIPWLIQNAGVKSFYLGGSDYAWPKGSFAALKTAVSTSGGTVVGEDYSPLGTTDFSSTLRRIQAAKPDVAYPLYAGADLIGFLKQFVSFGLHTSIKVASSAISESILPALPQQESTGWLASFEYFMTIDTPENKDFVQRYQQRFGNDATMDAIGEGMRTCVNLYATATKVAGSLDKEKVVTAMQSAQFSDPKGQLRVDPSSQCLVLNDYVAQIAPPGSGPPWQRLKIVQTFNGIKPQQICQSKPPS